MLSLKEKCDSEKSGRPRLNRKELERMTGFLNHLTMTFDDATPFLKGFYLTINSWRPQRDYDDWKMSDKRWREVMKEDDAVGLVDPDDTGPEMVVASSRLGSDVSALASIFASEVVPRVSLRSAKVVTVVYGFGDASGTGLGAKGKVIKLERIRQRGRSSGGRGGKRKLVGNGSIYVY